MQRQLTNVERKLPPLDEGKLSDMVDSYRYLMKARRVLDEVYSEAKDM